MKQLFIQLGRCFKPIFGFGNIGLYHWFIMLSEWVLIASLSASFVLELVNTDHTGWVQFFENYAIGVACSDLIVLVTSIAQFTIERNKQAKEYLSSAIDISYFMYAFKKHYESFDKEHSKDFFDGLVMHLKKYASKPHERLYWFCKEKDDLYNKLFRELNITALCLESSLDSIYDLTYNEIKDIIVDTNQLGKIVYSNSFDFLDSIALHVQLDAKEESLKEAEQSGDINDQL